jgi:hypothetical protein
VRRGDVEASALIDVRIGARHPHERLEAWPSFLVVCGDAENRGYTDATLRDGRPRGVLTDGHSAGRGLGRRCVERWRFSRCRPTLVDG